MSKFLEVPEGIISKILSILGSGLIATLNLVSSLLLLSPPTLLLTLPLHWPKIDVFF